MRRLNSRKRNKLLLKELDKRATIVIAILISIICDTSLKEYYNYNNLLPRITSMLIAMLLYTKMSRYSWVGDYRITEFDW